MGRGQLWFRDVIDEFFADSGDTVATQNPAEVRDKGWQVDTCLKCSFFPGNIRKITPKILVLNSTKSFSTGSLCPCNLPHYPLRKN